MSIGFTSIIQRQFSNTHRLINTGFKVAIMAWQAQPLCFFGYIFTLIIQGLIPMATAWLTKILFDLLSQSLHDRTMSLLLQKLLILLIAQACLIIISQLVSPINQFFNTELGRQLSLKINISLYQKINSFIGLSYFEDPHFHNTIQLATRGAQLSPLQFLTVLTSLLQSLVTILTFMGVLIAFNPLLALALGVAVLPQLYVQMKFGRQRFGIAIHNSPKERRASYYTQVLSWINFAKEVRLFNLGDYFLQAFIQTTREIQQVQRAQQKRELRWQLPLSILASITTTGAFVVVIMRAFLGYLSLGDVALYTSAVISVQPALLNLIMALSHMNESMLFYHQYLELLNLPQPVVTSRSKRPVPQLKFGITVCNASFRYSNQHPWILRHFNLFLPADRCLALVGLNGTGKTTLVKLLARFYDPLEGQILWDGIDIREFDPQELRQHIGAIFQDFSHYDLTVQHNIGMGNVTQIDNDEVIQQAAIKAGIHERIREFPQGYRSFLGRWLSDKDSGIDLSGGEWQKIALARMFMHDADLLILDEPTASLDAQTENDLYTQFGRLMRGRTSLLITHRFSSVRMADTIAVIENGQITEIGTHEELILSGGTYKHLYSMQAEQYR